VIGSFCFAKRDAMSTLAWRPDHAKPGAVSNLDQSMPLEMAKHFFGGNPSSISLDFTPSETPTMAAVLPANQ
jgi:hypothetical protein